MVSLLWATEVWPKEDKIWVCVSECTKPCHMRAEGCLTGKLVTQHDCVSAMQVVKEEHSLDGRGSFQSAGLAVTSADAGPDIDEIDARLQKLQQFLHAAKAGKAAR